MATHHGKEGVVTVGGTEMGEITSFTLEMHFDETDAQQETLLAGASISFVLLPEGNTAGDASYTGTGIVTGMSINNSMDAIVSRSVTFQGTGALTVGTV